MWGGTVDIAECRHLSTHGISHPHKRGASVGLPETGTGSLLHVRMREPPLAVTRCAANAAEGPRDELFSDYLGIKIYNAV